MVLRRRADRYSSNVCGLTSAGKRAGVRAFTLIELLVVVAIIALLLSILLPTLSGVRRQAQATRCLAHLRVLGQGIAIYTNDNHDVLPPGRLPKIDDCNAAANINGGRKFRPTFVAMMSVAVGAPPFADPQACKNTVDKFGEAGDRQNFSYAVYYCPSTPEWTDERNGSYGYNYQFLGNSRLANESVPDSYRNWPLKVDWIRQPGRTVAAGDCMGTAASFRPSERLPYLNNDRASPQRFGNEGFNLDPPRVDPVDGEMAGIDTAPQTRTALDPRHRERGNVLWLDSHAGGATMREMGYELDADGIVTYTGDNTRWSGTGRDEAWTPTYQRTVTP